MLLEQLGNALDLSTDARAAVAAALHAGAQLPDVLLPYAQSSTIAEAMAQVADLRCCLQSSDMELAHDWLQRVPVRIWSSTRVLPIHLKSSAAVSERLDQEELTIACANPFDATVIDTVRVACAGQIPTLIVVPKDILNEMLGEHLGVGADTVQSLLVGHVEEQGSDGDTDLAESADAAESASIIRLVNQILKEAIEHRATDVHFEPFEQRFAVRYRIDGVLVEAKLPDEVKHLRHAMVSRLKILAQLDIAEKRLPQDGRIKLMLSGHEVDVRVSVIPMLHGEAVVLRLLDRSAALVGLSATGMNDAQRQIYQDALHLPHGIVLITGPTGSGKTTSLYAGLGLINTSERKIVTIEDPVEYQLDGVNQIQVALKAGLTFAKGLRAILRHDPDVVLIGEIRDRETAEIAVQASLTGHLVLSTLHTNDAPGAVTRLIDMGIEPYLVASTLELVIAQRLVRLLCPACKVALAGQERSDALAVFADYDGPVYGPRGCRACAGMGYQGRQGIFEIMPVNDALRHAAGERISTPQLRSIATAQGMQSLRVDGLCLVQAGKTSVAEVLRNTHAGSVA